MSKRLTLALRLSGLGATRRDRVLIFLWSGYATLQRFNSFLPVQPIRVSLRFPRGSHRVEFRTISDLWVTKDVLLEREYDIPEPKDPRTIIDLGCNIGISSLFFALKYPNAHVYAIEPNPELRPQLAYNFRGVSNISLYPFALAEKDGTVTRYVGKHAAGSSLFATTLDPVEVEGVASENLLPRLGLTSADILKFDIEGAEQYLFSRFENRRSIECYIGEAHYDRMPVTAADIREQFPDYAVSEKPAGRKDRSILYILRKPEATA